MSHLIKRLLATILTIVMLIGIIPVGVFATELNFGGASNYVDTSGHWAGPAIDRWSKYGVLAGYGGKFRPDDPITRAEMAAVLQRVFGYSEMGDNPFTDVEKGKWYYDDVIKLASAGIMVGYGGKARPDDNITREEAVALIVRAFGIPALDADPNPFSDAGSISDWAKGVVNALHAAGYINGKPGNIFDPGASITRAEVVTIIDNFIKVFYNAPGEYSGTINGNVVVRSDGVILKDMTINGNLYVTAGVGNGSITLDNVTVSGEIINLGNGNIVNKDGKTVPPSTSGPNSGGGSSDGNNGGNSGDGSSSNITVSFETNGGSAISPVQITRGTTFANVPIPVKVNSAFSGWYTDRELSIPFYAGTLINSNLTLYAAYGEQENDLREYIDPDKYIEDCPVDFVISIASSAPLTEGNIWDCAFLSSKTAYTLPAIGVTGSNGLYTLTPKTPYQEGRLYTLSLLDGRLSFSGEDPGVRNLTFRIHKDEVAHMKYRDGIIDVLWRDVTEVAGYSYMIPADSYPAIPNTYTHVPLDENNPESYDPFIIRFWDGEENEDTAWRKVMLVTLIEGEDGDFLLLDTEDCEFGEVYDELDLYFDEMANMWGLVQSLDAEQIKRDTLSGPGVTQLGDMLMEAISLSPTVRTLLAEPGDPGIQPMSLDTVLMASAFQPFSNSSDTWSLAEYPDILFPGEPRVGGLRIDDLPIYNLLNFDSITVDFAIGSTDNSNFPVNSERTVDSREVYAEKCRKLSGYCSEEDIQQMIDDWPCVWPVIELHVKFAKTFKNKIQVEADVTIREYLTVSVQGGCEYSGKWWSPSSWDDFAFDIAHNIYSRTDVDFDIVVKTKDGSGDYNIDININDEITKLMNGEAGQEPGTVMQKVLEAKGEYIDIVEAKIIAGDITIIPECPVGQVNLELFFVLRINIAAGISSHMSFLTAQQIGVCGDFDIPELDFYRNNLPQNGCYDIDIDAAGYIGVKAGLRGKISVSLYKLEKLAKAGVAVEMGVYGDLYGFVRAHVEKHQQDGRTMSSVIGGLYFEAGVYGELQLFAESELFMARASYSVIELKLPLFTLGDRYVLLGFPNTADRILMREDSLSLNIGSLYTANYLDLKTGAVVTGGYTDMDRFSIGISNRLFEIQGGNIVLRRDRLQPNTTRADANLQIYYNGTTLTSGRPTWLLEDGVWGITWEENDIWYYTHTAVKTVTLTWIDPSVDISGIGDIGSTYTATYILVADGVETTLEVKDVLAGQQPGGPTVTDQGFKLSTTDPTRYVTTIREELVQVGDLLGSRIYTFAEVISYLHNVRVTSYDDFYRPISGNTVYRIYAQTPQRIVSFLTYYGGRWNLDVYAANYGVAPMPPSNYDTTSYMSFINWGYRDGGGQLYSNTPEPLPLGSYIIKDNEGIYSGLATGAPLYHFDSQDAGLCRKADTGYTIGRAYEAQYDVAYFDIEWQFPAVSYFPARTFHSVNEGGKSIDRLPGALTIEANAYVDAYAVTGFEVQGTTYSSIGDIPVVTGPMTIRCIVQINTYTVTILDGNGNVAAPVAKDYHDSLYDVAALFDQSYAPIVVGTKPAHPSDPSYTFSHWEMSTDGGEYRRNVNFVYGDMIIRPVYVKNITLTFNYKSATGVNTSTNKYAYSGAPYTIEAGIAPATVTPVADDGYIYTFSHWIDGNNITYNSGDTFAAADEMTFTAVYTQTPRTYTITFDANGGTFPVGTGMSATWTKTYAFGATINPAEIPVPTKYAPGYTYEFDGWTPAFATVTGTATYAAIWIETPVVLPSGVITVDGVQIVENDPDEAGYNAGLGYNYRLEQGIKYDPVTGDSVFCDIPTLTIITNGLTVSGTLIGGIEDALRIRFDNGVTDVIFENLSLTTEYIDDIIYHETDTLLTITIKGDCVFAYAPDFPDDSRGLLFWAHTDTTFVGGGANPMLTLILENAEGFACYGDLTFQDITLHIEASDNASAFSGGDGAGSTIRFENVSAEIVSPGSNSLGIGISSIIIAGDTSFTYVSNDADNPVLTIAGDLIFEDFEGGFKLSYASADATSPALLVAGETKFIINGVELDPLDYGLYYDFSGAQIIRVHIDEWYDGVDYGRDWYTFSLDSTIPAVWVDVTGY